MIKDYAVFVKEFFLSFHTTGSFWPTSARAAEALAAPMRAAASPRRILEIGPGTGSVTVVLLRQMSDQDTLTVCEINPRFMAALKKKLASNPDYQRHQRRVTFFQGPVQDMPDAARFNAVVCAVPFNNFDRDTTDAIFSKVERLADGTAQMSYYEYIGLRHAGKYSPSPKQRERVKGVEQYLKKSWMPRLVQRKSIWQNLLPIYVYTLNLADGMSGARYHAAVA